MKLVSRLQRFFILMGALTASMSLPVIAEDIDIFGGDALVNTGLPNVIFVLDNTSNWSTNSQQFDGSYVMGQTEVVAIKNVLANQVGKLNVGIVEFVTRGNANDNGAFVRYDLQELNDASSLELFGLLDTMRDSVNDPQEKRNSNTEFGDLMFDTYNYLAGEDQSDDGDGTPGAGDGDLADVDAYETPYGVFRSPLTTQDACVDTYLIFIVNPNNSGPRGDDANNSTVLRDLYTAAGETAPDQLADDLSSRSSLDPLPLGEASVVDPGDPEEPVEVGVTSDCYRDNQVSSCATDVNADGFGAVCGVGDTTCTCGTGSESRVLACGQNKYTRTVTTVVAGEEESEELVGVEEDDGVDWNLDDWAKFMRNVGIPFSGLLDPNDPNSAFSERISVKSYAIDVYKAKQNLPTTALLRSMADVGGGEYYAASSLEELEFAISGALGDILSVSSSFAAVTLPLSATNRARVDNQVFIGMFRPAKGKEPRWYGNLKKYQLALVGEAKTPRLVDSNFALAINPLTGFAGECAETFWTTDSGSYWDDLGIDPPAKGACLLETVLTSDWSDLPDGPFVEKGGIAQMTREGPAGTLRTLYTVSNMDVLEALDDPNDVGGDTIMTYFQGDTAGVGEKALEPDSGLRSSIHGDVVHSRPLSVLYDDDVLRLYYGANDGLFRGADAATGQEKWALLAPEHNGKVKRLYDNAPLIQYSGRVEEVPEDYESKDYFFDGSSGSLVEYDDADGGDRSLQRAYIYPTMRRGGRTVYALDVTDPNTPSMLWRKGCPIASDPNGVHDDTGCDTGFTEIGQTWSVPRTGYVEGYVDFANDPNAAVAIFGGGYDQCLDLDQATYPTGCSTAKGKGVYIVDAETGALIKYFATEAPVLSEVGVVDIDFDGDIDFAYPADAKGNLYRITFSDLTSINPDAFGALTTRAVTDWTIDKIAYAPDSNVRFFNAPTVGGFKGVVIVSIGTGDRERPLETNYPYASDVQNTFYAFIDRPYDDVVNGSGNNDGLRHPVSAVDLENNTTMLEISESATGPAEGETLNDYDGWYMDLTDQGEQVANPAAIAGGKVFFNTFQPGGASTGICTKPLGIGTAYAVDLFDPSFSEGTPIVGGGFPIPPVIATVKIPPQPSCVGAGCPDITTEEICEQQGGCEVKTICIGCEGFEPVEVVPIAPPIRDRFYRIEQVDADN